MSTDIKENLADDLTNAVPLQETASLETVVPSEASLPNDSTSKSPTTDIEEDKRRKRAERFGLVDEASKKKARAERFNLSSEEDKKAKRLERFGGSTNSVKSAKASEGVKKSPSASKEANPQEIEKRLKRAERFGLPVASSAATEEMKKKRAEKFAPLSYEAKA